MSKTACWLFNDTFDCGWFRAGYGSRWDMLFNTYERGYWLSKKGVELLLYYDYDIREEDLEEYNTIYWDHPSFKANKKHFLALSGGFMRDFPDYRETRYEYTGREYEVKLPSIENGIRKHSIKNYNRIQRMLSIDENAQFSYWKRREEWRKENTWNPTKEELEALEWE